MEVENDTTEAIRHRMNTTEESGSVVEQLTAIKGRLDFLIVWNFFLTLGLFLVVIFGVITFREVWKKLDRVYNHVFPPSLSLSPPNSSENNRENGNGDGNNASSDPPSLPSYNSAVPPGARLPEEIPLNSGPGVSG